MNLFITDLIWVLIFQAFVFSIAVGGFMFFYFRLKYMDKIKVDPVNVFRRKETVETVKRNLEGLRAKNFS